MSAALRIGVDAACLANGRGYGRFTRELLAALVESAREHQFVLYGDRGTLHEVDVGASNVQVVHVAQNVSPAHAAAADGYRSPADMLRLTRAVWRDRPDVFWSPSVYTYFPLPPGQPSLITIHDTITERYPELTMPSRRARLFWNAKVKLALWQATLVLTVSDFAAARDRGDPRRLRRSPSRRRRSGGAHLPAEHRERGGTRGRRGRRPCGRAVVHLRRRLHSAQERRPHRPRARRARRRGARAGRAGPASRAGRHDERRQLPRRRRRNPRGDRAVRHVGVRAVDGLRARRGAPPPAHGDARGAPAIGERRVRSSRRRRRRVRRAGRGDDGQPVAAAARGRRLFRRAGRRRSARCRRCARCSTATSASGAAASRSSAPLASRGAPARAPRSPRCTTSWRSRVAAPRFPPSRDVPSLLHGHHVLSAATASAGTPWPCSRSRERSCASGHHVTVVCDDDAYRTLSRNRDPVPPADDDGVVVHRLCERHRALAVALTQQTGRPVVHGATLRRILDRGAFDVIHYHNLSLVGGPAALCVRPRR